MRKMSRIAVRESTNSIPSSAISRPAAQPSTVERNSRRAKRVMISTARMPHRAAVKRQVKACETEWLPSNSLIPAAMIHLPSGGWTTKSANDAVGCPAALVAVRNSTLWSSNCWPSWA